MYGQHRAQRQQHGKHHQAMHTQAPDFCWMRRNAELSLRAHKVVQHQPQPTT